MTVTVRRIQITVYVCTDSSFICKLIYQDYQLFLDISSQKKCLVRCMRKVNCSLPMDSSAVIDSGSLFNV